jgi:hypothetical protein
MQSDETLGDKIFRIGIIVAVAGLLAIIQYVVSTRSLYDGF